MTADAQPIGYQAEGQTVCLPCARRLYGEVPEIDNSVDHYGQPLGRVYHPQCCEECGQELKLDAPHQEGQRDPNIKDQLGVSYLEPLTLIIGDNTKWTCMVCCNPIPASEPMGQSTNAKGDVTQWCMLCLWENRLFVGPTVAESQGDYSLDALRVVTRIPITLPAA